MQLDANVVAEVVKCVQKVIDGSTQAAIKLCQLGVITRHSTLPRGTPEEGATNQLPDRSNLLGLMACLKDAEGYFLCRLMSVLGHWGNGEVITALQDRMKQVSKDEMRHVWGFYIGSIECIGGPQALQILQELAIGESPVQNMARYSLKELVTGGCLDYSEGYTSDQEQRWGEFCRTDK